MKKRQQSWADSTSVGLIAVKAVLNFLASKQAHENWNLVRSVESVEDKPYFQKQEIDLITLVHQKGTLEKVTIEVKGDRHYDKGNFFLETISDIARNTTGAFIVCQADWYFYYFLSPKRLYCLPRETAQDWFYKVSESLPSRIASSQRNGRTWKTSGKLAPIARITKEVVGVVCFEKGTNGWVKIIA